MDSRRSKFAGGDQGYLRDEQYRDSSRLAQRANLHARYSTAPRPWLVWVADKFDIPSGADVLEAGCGAGWLWESASSSVPAGVSLTLTDLSPGMVDEAVHRARSTNVFGAVAGQPADLQNLPFDDQSFDRIIANHMLYHLPDPVLGVAELARVVRPDGFVIVATNGHGHMRELWQTRSVVFDTPSTDPTIEVFGAEVGFAILRRQFCDVQWSSYVDALQCTDPDDVVAYVCSTPPGENATPSQLAALERSIAMAFEQGGGTMRITKDVGCFVCRNPIRAATPSLDTT